MKVRKLPHSSATLLVNRFHSEFIAFQSTTRMPWYASRNVTQSQKPNAIAAIFRAERMKLPRQKAARKLKPRRNTPLPTGSSTGVVAVAWPGTSVAPPGPDDKPVMSPEPPVPDPAKARLEMPPTATLATATASATFFHRGMSRSHSAKVRPVERTGGGTFGLVMTREPIHDHDRRRQRPSRRARHGDSKHDRARVRRLSTPSARVGAGSAPRLGFLLAVDRECRTDVLPRRTTAIPVRAAAH